MLNSVCFIRHYLNSTWLVDGSHVPCAVVSSLHLVLPSAVLTSLFLFGIVIARVGNIHPNCKFFARALIFLWLLSHFCLICADFSSQAARFLHGVCLPQGVCTPAVQLPSFTLHLSAYGLSSFSEAALLVERYIASRLLDRYLPSSRSFLVLISSIAFVIAASSCFGYVTVLGDCHIFGFIFITVVDVTNIIMNMILWRRAKRRYVEQLGTVGLAARYQLLEVQQLNSILLRVTVISGLNKCVSLIGAYGFMMDALDISLFYNPPFYAHNAHFFAGHTINCAVVVWIFMLYHGQMRQMLRQVLGGLGAKLIKPHWGTAVAPTAGCPPGIKEGDKYFEMLSQSWG